MQDEKNKNEQNNIKCPNRMHARQLISARITFSILKTYMFLPLEITILISKKLTEYSQLLEH